MKKKIIGFMAAVALMAGACGGSGGTTPNPGTPSANAAVSDLTPAQQKVLSSNIPYSDPSEDPSKSFTSNSVSTSGSILSEGSLLRHILSNPKAYMGASAAKTVDGVSCSSDGSSCTYENSMGGTFTIFIDGDITSAGDVVTYNNLILEITFNNFVTENFCDETVTLNGKIRVTENGTMDSSGDDLIYDLSGTITTPTALTIAAADGTHTVTYNMAFDAFGSYLSSSTWTSTGTVTIDGLTLDVNDLEDLDPICD